MQSIGRVSTALFVVAIGLALATLTGCDEYSSTPALTKHEAEAVTTLKTQPVATVLPLEGVLRVPGRGFNSFANIKGSITYSLTSTLENGLYRLDVELQTEASLSFNDIERDDLSVSENSHDVVIVSEEGIALLDKSYRINGLREPLRLHVRFLLTSDGICVNSMWLQRLRLHATEGDAG